MAWLGYNELTCIFSPLNIFFLISDWQDYIWLALFIVYQVAFLVLPVRVVYRHQLPPISTVIIVCEQIRLVMKAHAFVRHNIPRVLKYDSKNGKYSKARFFFQSIMATSLEHYVISLHRPLHCFFKSLSKLTTKKPSKLCIIGPLYRESTANYWIPCKTRPIMWKIYIHLMTSSGLWSWIYY